MPLDFGTALANVGQMWAQVPGAIRARETEEQKIAFDQLMRRQQMQQNQGQLDLQREQAAQQQAKQIFDQTLSLVKEGPSLPLNEAQMQGLDKRLAPAFFKELPQPVATPTALGMDGKPIEGTQTLPAVEGEGKFYGFEPGESEKLRTAQLNATNRSNDLMTRLSAQQNIQGMKNDNALQRTQLIIDDRRAGRDNSNQQRDLDRQLRREQSKARLSGLGNIPNSIKDEMGTLNTAQDLATLSIQLGDTIEWAGVGGFGAGSVKQGLNRHLGVGSEQAESLRNMIGNIQGTIAKLRAGTSFTAGEKELLLMYTPDINSSPEQIRTKLEGLSNYLDLLRENKIAVFTSQDFGKNRPTPTLSGFQGGGAQSQPPPQSAAPPQAGPTIANAPKKREKYDPATGQFIPVP